MIWLRSIGAVLAGALAIVALHTGTDLLMERVFAPLDPVYLGIAVVYRNIYNVFAGWLTARLAPFAPVGHAAVLGAIGMVLNAVGALVMWQVGAHWYPVLLTLLALPSCWLGGWLAARQPIAS